MLVARGTCEALSEGIQKPDQLMKCILVSSGSTYSALSGIQTGLSVIGGGCDNKDVKELSLLSPGE